ncbi:MAG: phytanoyl-CoA dioxygenase family protein [Bacteroidota bacterium]
MVTSTSTRTVKCPLGNDLEVPEGVMANDPYPSLEEPEKMQAYFEEHGYIVIRNLIPEELCKEALSSFKQEVRPYKGHIYRQASANPEKHKWTDHDHMLNSILNVQSVNSSKFPSFRKTGLSALTHPNVQKAMDVLMGEAGKLVQSMYFEGNPTTWAHQDCYYLDSEDQGRMIGSWFALEDIHAEAGRFYVYPGSHKIDIEKNGGDFNIAFSHDRYKQLVKDIIVKFGLECKAPALNQGDVLFWHAATIHGSLETTDRAYSRSSYTGHYIPDSTRFLQWQSRIKPLDLKEVNGMNVNFPKDLDKFSNKAILAVETTFPKQFQWLKKQATKAVTK